MHNEEVNPSSPASHETFQKADGQARSGKEKAAKQRAGREEGGSSTDPPEPQQDKPGAETKHERSNTKEPKIEVVSDIESILPGAKFPDGVYTYLCQPSDEDGEEGSSYLAIVILPDSMNKGAPFRGN
jgi:hypothetical protein